MTAVTTPSRAYLRPAQRRRQLLDAAARVFARTGYEGLTMVALADEAAVSRRLVYDHFPDLASLYGAFFDDQVAVALLAIDAAVADAGDAGSAFGAAFACLTTMPGDRQRAIRLVAAGAGRPELEALRDRLRAHIEARWLDLVTRSAPSLDDARTLLWALVNGLLTLAELTARGEVESEAAVAIARQLVSGALTAQR
jgi:AcrR family transcriptional regulator